MVLRILILLLLALAFAGPLSREKEVAEGPVLQPRNLLLLDDTYSMTLPVPGDQGSTAYDQARQFVLELIRGSEVEWKVAMASDLLGNREGDESLAVGYEEVLDLLKRHPTAEAAGRIETAIEKASALLDEQTSLWVVSDTAASNWTRHGERGKRNREQIEIVQVEGPQNRANWALTGLSLNNQPLLEGEPALLAGRVEFFGSESTLPSPPMIRYGVKSETRSVSFETGQPIREMANQYTVQSSVPAEGTVLEASASLVFSQGSTDLLPRDNHAVLVPRYLEGVRVLVVTESEAWGRLLQAALVGFDQATTSSQVPPPPEAASYSSYLFLLEENPPDTEWNDFLRQRVRSGAGVLFLYDAEPGSLRLQTWTDWWTQWETMFVAEEFGEGAKEWLPGHREWFYSSLDPTARKTEWAEGRVGVVVLDGWEVEARLNEEGKGDRPVFQTRKVGQGTAAVWNVPLSPRETSLLYSTAWVPLLSQMVKRTLIDPAGFSGAGTEALRDESDLSVLSPEEKQSLERAGYRFYSVGEVISRLAQLPRGQKNWTQVLLLICLILALAEIGVSNYV